MFTDSSSELKSVKTLTIMAMLGAITIILGKLSIEIGIFAAALDVIKYLLNPTTGPFCPQLTLVAMLGGIMYGCFFYKKKLTLPRILAAKFAVALICNVILTTLCLKFLYGQALMAILPMRALKNLIMWPIDSAILYTLIQIMDRAGIFRIIQQSREQGKQVS